MAAKYNVMRALIAFNTMTAIYVVHDKNPISIWDEIIRSWMQLWTTYIWKWMEYLLRYIEDGNNSSHRLYAFKVVVEFLSVLAKNQGFLQLAASQDVCKLLKRLWYLEVKESCFNPWLSDGPRSTVILSGVVRAYIEALLKSGDLDWVAIVIAPMGGDVSEVASAAIFHLRGPLSQSPVDHVRLALATYFMTTLARYPHISYVLLANNSPRLVTNAFVSLAASPVSKDLDSFTLSATACTSYLATCTRATTGLDWVIQMVEANILTAFVKLSSWMDRVYAQSGYGSFDPSLAILSRIYHCSDTGREVLE